MHYLKNGATITRTGVISSGLLETTSKMKETGKPTWHVFFLRVQYHMLTRTTKRVWSNGKTFTVNNHVNTYGGEELINGVEMYNNWKSDSNQPTGVSLT